MGGGASVEPATYYAKAPMNVKDGDVIPADVNGKPVHVKVPAGTRPGQLFKFTDADCVAAPPPPSGPSLFGQAPHMGPVMTPSAPSNSLTTSSPVSPGFGGPAPYQPQGYNNNIPMQQLQQPGMPQQYAVYSQPGLQLHQQQQQVAPQSQPTSTAGMSGAQIVQQFGYNKPPQSSGASMVQQLQQSQGQPAVNTPFPQQHYQQQSQLQQQLPQFMGALQQFGGMPMQSFGMQPQQQHHQQQQQQYMMAPQQHQQQQAPMMYQQHQYNGQPMQQQQFAAPQLYGSQAVQTHIPVATPVSESGFHGGAALNRGY